MWLRLMNGRRPSSETRSDTVKLFLVQASGSEAHVRGAAMQRERGNLPGAHTSNCHPSPFYLSLLLLRGVMGRPPRGSAMLITSKLKCARFKDSEVIGPGALGGTGAPLPSVRGPLSRELGEQGTDPITKNISMEY